MQWSEITSRLNGISTPFFGLSWEPARSDVTTVRGLIHFLEGRRVLWERHHPAESVQAGRDRVEKSMQDIRSFLTGTLVQGGLSDELTSSIKLMRRLTLEGLDALERWQDYCGSLVKQPHEWSREDDALRVEWDDAKEDYLASLALFKQGMRKTAHEVAQAHSLELTLD